MNKHKTKKIQGKTIGEKGEFVDSKGYVRDNSVLDSYGNNFAKEL